MLKKILKNLYNKKELSTIDKIDRILKKLDKIDLTKILELELQEIFTKNIAFAISVLSYTLTYITEDIKYRPPKVRDTDWTNILFVNWYTEDGWLIQDKNTLKTYLNLAKRLLEEEIKLDPSKGTSSSILRQCGPMLKEVRTIVDTIFTKL